MFKKILFLLLSVVLFNTSFAITNDLVKGRWDCWLLNRKSIEDTVNKIFQSSNYEIIEPKDLKIALTHLDEYCKCVSDGTCSSYVGAESTFLFDQLLDVIFRKLDAIDGLYRWEPDVIWKQRRQFIENEITKIHWDIPENIYKKFKDYWDTQNGKLYKRYQKACDEIVSILSNWVWIFPSNYKKEDTSFSIDKQNLLAICHNQVLSRLNKEVAYIQYMMIDKWNKALKTLRENYLMRQIVVKDWPRLLEKFSKFLWYFTRVIKLVGEWTKNCNR